MELVPGLKRVAVLSHPTTPSNPKQLEGAEVAARALGIDVKPVPVRNPDDFDAAFEAARGADGLLLLDIAAISVAMEMLRFTISAPLQSRAQGNCRLVYTCR
jgi:ABC-type uncharacterized transport system substrate-binding protein